MLKNECRSSNQSVSVCKTNLRRAIGAANRSALPEHLVHLVSVQANWSKPIASLRLGSSVCARASPRLVNRGGKWQVVAGRIAWLIAGGVVVVAVRSTDWRCWGGMGATSCRWFKSLPGLVCRCGPVSGGWSGKR